jgi:DNA polymerase-3 subunit epsilon
MGSRLLEQGSRPECRVDEVDAWAALLTPMAKKSAYQQIGDPASRHVAVDIETTGLYPQRGARIVEIGAVALEGGGCVAEFETLIDCRKEIPRRVQEVHGISTEMLAGQAPPEEAFPSFLRFASRSTLVAHNAKFDINFLRYELARLGLGMNNAYVCTLRMSRRLYPQLANHKLETVARHLLGPLPVGTRLHRALEDARLVAKVWMALEGIR